MKILFVDHAMHKLTTSSLFFVDILKSRFDVDVAFLDPSDLTEQKVDEFDKAQNWSDYDLVIAWQHEAVAAIASQHRIPIVIVPMYDASANMGKPQWRLYDDCSMLNFSYTLHTRTKPVIPHQKYIQYFPDPAKYRPVNHEDGVRVFFWMRRPEDLGLEGVVRLVRGGFDTIHVHTKADGSDVAPPLPDWTASYNITSSHWFEDRADFDALLDNYNVMVCPRMSEGIGMLMLEALARGMCVIAHREPTHTEYIADNVNGYLFDRHGYSPPDIRRRGHLGAMARRGVEVGHQRWQESLKELPEFLLAAAMRPTRPFCSPDSARKLLLQSITDYPEYLKHSEYLAHKKPAAARTETSFSAGNALSATNRARSLVSQTPNLQIAARHDNGLSEVRQLMGRVPGWRNVKSLVPTKVKTRVASALAGIMGASRG